METFVRSSPSYSSNGRKCIGSKAYILVSQILFNVLWNKHFQLVLRDIRTANHPFSAVTRSVTKIEGVSMFRTRIYFAVNVFNVVYYWEIGKTSLTCRRKRHKNWRSSFFVWTLCWKSGRFYFYCFKGHDLHIFCKNLTLYFECKFTQWRYIFF